MSDKTKTPRTNETYLLANKELERTIETIIKKDTPEREVYFENRIIEEDIDVTYHFEVYTKNPDDPFMLLLKKQEKSGMELSEHQRDHYGLEKRDQVFHFFRGGFLQELRDELVNKEKADRHNRYWVEWYYYEKGEGGEPTRRTSHFIGKGLKEVVDKLENSVPKDYEFTIKKVELLAES